MKIRDLLLLGLRLAGVGQLIIALVYGQMLRIVAWDTDVAHLCPHNRRIARTYSRYIQVFTTVFGLICLFQPHELLAKVPLAIDLTLLIGMYWLGRLLVGLFYYDLREIIALRRNYFYLTLALNALFVAQITALFGALAYNLNLLTD